MSKKLSPVLVEPTEGNCKKALCQGACSEISAFLEADIDKTISLEDIITDLIKRCEL